MQNNEELSFDFSYILKTIYKRILLILFILIIGIGASYYYTYKADVLYQSESTLYVKPISLGTEGVEYNDILSSQRLVKTYIEMIKSRTIMEDVIKELDLDLNYAELLKKVVVGSVKDTEIITIAVKDTDPAMAKKIANTITNIFIEDIKSTMDVENIKVIDAAIQNNKPVSPNIILNFLIATFASLGVGVFLSFILESMDNKIKTHEDVKKYLKLENIGVIPHNSCDTDIIGASKKNKKNVSKIVSSSNLKIISEPTSVISEAYRMIRTNINFLDLKVLNVTSTLPSEGKSNIVANLAVAFAMTGKKVIVIDCDIRKPVMHKLFSLQQRVPGITDLVIKVDADNYKSVINEFKVSDDVKLDIITAGSKVSNPSELLNSLKFSQLISKIKEDYDLVLLDCPPASLVTDALLVSRISDGTLYTIESDRIDYRVINNSIEQFKNSNVFVLGTILNKVNIKREKKLYGHKYEYYYNNYR